MWLSKEEAKVAYNEGAQLFIQASQSPKTISLGQVKAARDITKNEFTPHAKKTLDAANAAHQSTHRSSKLTATKVVMEIEI